MTARIGYLSALAGEGAQGLLRPPRRVPGDAGFPGAEPGTLDEPGLANAPGFSGTPRLRDELTARPDADEARIAGLPAGHAVPQSSRPAPAPSLGLRPDLAARAPRPRPPASPPAPPDTLPAASDAAADGPGDPSRASTSAAPRNSLTGGPDEEAADRSATSARAPVSPVEAGGARRAVLERPTVMPGAPQGRPDGPADAGHPLAAVLARAKSDSAGHGPAPRVAGEPWRVPRLGQPWPGRRDTAASGAPPSNLAPVANLGPATAPPAAALAAVALPDRMPRDRAAGQRPSSSASPLPGDVLPGSPAVPASGPGSGQPGAAAKLPPRLPAAAALASTALEASAQSAAPLPAAQPPGSAAAPLPAAQPPGSAAAPLPAAQPPGSAALPPDASLPVAPPVGSVGSSPGRSAADRAQARLTPAVNPANRPSGTRAETPPRPSAPTLSIGAIEVTLLPPPLPAPVPARPGQHEPPRRLSRGLGRRFGQGQA
jgi:hypothetical protein